MASSRPWASTPPSDGQAPAAAEAAAATTVSPPEGGRSPETPAASTAAAATAAAAAAASTPGGGHSPGISAATGLGEVSSVVAGASPVGPGASPAPPAVPPHSSETPATMDQSASPATSPAPLHPPETPADEETRTASEDMWAYMVHDDYDGDVPVRVWGQRQFKVTPAVTRARARQEVSTPGVFALLASQNDITRSLTEVTVPGVAPDLPSEPACEMETPESYAQAHAGPHSIIWEAAQIKELVGLTAANTSGGRNIASRDQRHHGEMGLRMEGGRFWTCCACQGKVSGPWLCAP